METIAEVISEAPDLVAQSAEPDEFARMLNEAASGICTCGPRKKRTPAVCITADAMRGGGGTIDRNHTLRASQDVLDFGGAS